MLFTTVYKRSWRIEVVDRLTAPVKLAIFRPALNQETSVSAFPQLSCGSNNATWTRKSEQAETSTCKWLAARHHNSNELHICCLNSTYSFDLLRYLIRSIETVLLNWVPAIRKASIRKMTIKQRLPMMELKPVIFAPHLFVPEEGIFTWKHPLLRVKGIRVGFIARSPRRP